MFASGEPEGHVEEPSIRSLEIGGFREIQARQQGGDEDTDSGVSELRAMAGCYRALHPVPNDGKVRAILWIIQNYQLEELFEEHLTATSPSSRAETDSGPRSVTEDVSPRTFMGLKKPQTQTERIACLAYYLTYHRNTPHFKAKDIDALNTEAAGQKLGHLTRDVDNADRQSGYIVSAGAGMKQLTVRGEAVVKALPARNAVKEAILEHGYRMKRSSSGGRKDPANAEDQQ